MAYASVKSAMPPCDCIEWRFFVVVWRDIAVPLAVAGTAAIVGIVGSFGLLRVPDGLRRAAAALGPPARSGTSLRWTLATTLVAMPVVIASLSWTHPALVGIAPFGGVLLAWIGHFTRNTPLTAAGVLLGLVPGVLLGLGLLVFFLFLTSSSVPII